MKLLEQIISIVSDLTEISPDEIRSRSRRSDVTEARYLVIYLLRHQGVRTYKIAKMMGIPERSIYYAINAYNIHSDEDGSMLKTWFRDAKIELQKLRRNEAESSQ